MVWLWQDSKHSQGNQETSFAKEVITHTSYMPTKRRDNYTIKFLAKVSLSLSRLGYGLAARFCLWFGIKVWYKNRNATYGSSIKKGWQLRGMRGHQCSKFADEQVKKKTAQIGRAVLKIQKKMPKSFLDGLRMTNAKPQSKLNLLISI